MSKPTPLPTGTVIAVVVLFGLAPAAVSPTGLNPMLPVKVAAVALGLWLALRQVRALRVPDGRPIAVAAAALIGWLAVAAVTSDAPLTSLLGTPTRFLGLAAWVGFALAAAVGASLAHRHGGPWILRVAARASAVPIVVGAAMVGAELADAPLVPIALEFEGRASGLFANPGLTAAHLALVLPLVVGASIDDRDWRPLHAASAILGAATLLATQTRAVLIALTVVGLVVAIVGWRDRRRQGADPVGTRGGREVSRALALGGGALVLVVLLGGLLVAAGRWQGAGGTLAGRIDTWDVAAQVIQEQPVLGTGPEGFAAAFVTQVDEEFVVTWSREQLTDRAHNVVLDVTAAGGLPAGAAHLVLVGAVGALLWRRRGDGPIVVGASAGVAAMLIQQLVLFPQPVHDTLLWFVIGVLGATSTRPLGPRSRTVGAALAGGLVLWGVLGVAADLQAGSALRQDGLTAVRTALGIPDLQPVGDLPGLVIADRALASGEPAALAAAESAVADVEGRAFATGLARLARVDLLLASHRASPGGSDLDRAQTLLCELLARDTTNGDAWLKLGVVAFEQDRFPEAAAAWQRADRLLPGRDEPSDNLATLAALPGDAPVEPAAEPDAACR